MIDASGGGSAPDATVTTGPPDLSGDVDRARQLADEACRLRDGLTAKITKLADHLAAAQAALPGAESAAADAEREVLAATARAHAGEG